MQVNISVRKPTRFVLLALALVGILFLVDSPSNIADAKPPTVVNPANGHCYRFISTENTWNTAFSTAPTLPSPDAACAGSTGYLVVINNAAENAFVRGLFGEGSVWLGGSDVASEGTWRWLSAPVTPIFCIALGPGNCPARPGSYVNWDFVEPNNVADFEHCLQMYDTGTWNDLACTRTLGYVVEYDPAGVPKEVPEGDTLLLLGSGMGGLGVWLRYQWSKRKKEVK